MICLKYHTFGSTSPACRLKMWNITQRREAGNWNLRIANADDDKQLYISTLTRNFRYERKRYSSHDEEYMAWNYYATCHIRRDTPHTDISLYILNLLTRGSTSLCCLSLKQCNVVCYTKPESHTKLNFFIRQPIFCSYLSVTEQRWWFASYTQQATMAQFSQMPYRFVCFNTVEQVWWIFLFATARSSCLFSVGKLRHLFYRFHGAKREV